MEHEFHNMDTTDRLARIETTLTILSTRLLGNGQPGELSKINTRLTDLEDTKSRFRGALWAAGIAITVISGGLLHHLGVPGFR